MGDTRVFELADGRELAWVEFGASDGVPVVAMHGSPGTGSFFASQHQTAANAGVRLIAPDRPGYGHSTFHADRTYESWAHDVDQLADHLGVDRLAVVGHSSGGPNAAVCARLLHDRLLGCAIVSGLAPPEAHVSKDGMLRSNRMFQAMESVSPRLASALFGAGLRQGQRAPDKALAWMRRTLPPCDVAVIDRPEIFANVRADLVRPLSSSAARAAVQDSTLERRKWGFRLEDIELPVHVWHGDADRNVVFASGTYLAGAIPGATLHPLPGEGHWLIFDHFDEILDRII